MSPPKVVGEDEQGFTLHDGASPFRVPKKGLSPKLEARIRAMGAGAAETAAQTTTYSPDAIAPDAGLRLTVGAPVEIPQPVELARPAPVAPLPLGMSPEERPVDPGGPPSPNLAAEFGKRRDAERKAAEERRLGMPLGDDWEKQIAPPRANEGFGLGDQGRALGISRDDAGPTAPPAAVAPVAPIAAARKPTGGGAAAPLPGMADISGGLEVQKGAGVMGANIEADKARQTAEAIGAFDAQLKANAVDEKVRLDEARARTEQVMSSYKAAQEDMRNISTTVDPGRFWASKSTMGKIAGVIGLALGALGAGPDGINRAAQMLNQAIDRDLEAQKAEHTFRIAKGKAAIDAAQSAYGMEHQRFGNEVAASNAAKASLLGLAENNLRKIAAGAAGPQAQAQALALAGQLQTQKGQLEAAAANTAFDNMTQRIAVNAQANKSPIGQASATALTEIENRNKNIHNSGKKLLALIDAYGTSETYTPGIEGQMGQLVTDMAVDAAKLKDPTSVARPGEVELELSNLFKPGMWQRAASAKAKIQAFLDNAQTRRAVAYQVRGLPDPGAR